MMLIHPGIGKQFIIEEGYVNVLYIENEKFICDIISELILQVSGGEGRFILSDKLKELEISKNMDVIIDFFNLNINQKKIINKLYLILKDIAVGNDYYIKTNKVINDISELISDISYEINVPISYNFEVELLDLFKISGIKIEEDGDSLLENLLHYIYIMKELCKINCFVFVNLKQFLNMDDVEKLYNYIEYNKINIILIEGKIRIRENKRESIYIMDKDMCEIY